MDKSKEIKKLNEDKFKAKQKQNFKEVILFCNYLGDIYSSIGDYNKAIEQHKEELDYARKLNDSLSIAVSYRRLGECYSEINEFQNALNFQHKYLSIVEKLNNTIEIQRAWATLGRTYFLHYSSDNEKNKNSLNVAENSQLKALSLTERLKKSLKERDWAEMRCRALLNLGLIYDLKDDEQECSSHFKRAISIAKNYGFKEDLNRCEFSLGSFYLKIGFYSQALKFFDLAIVSAKQLKNKLILYDTLLAKGQVFLNLRDYDSSKHCFKKAYYIYNVESEENQEAKKNLTLTKKIIISLRELINCEDKSKKIKTCDKLGDIFVELSCYSIAIEYYNEELKLALEENFSDSQLSSIYLSLGQTYLDNKQFSEAIYNFEKELKCNKGKLKEEIRIKLKIIEVKSLMNRNNEEIIEEYNKILKLNLDNKLKKIVYKDFLDFLEEISDSKELYFELINQIKSKLKELNELDNCNTAYESSQSSNDEETSLEIILSEVSDLTSDSDTEENEELLERKNRNSRTRKNLIEKRNEKGETPLHRACIEGNLLQVEKLIEKGHKINPRDNCGWLPIHEASNHGFSEIVELLVKHHAWINDPGGRDCDGTTPLHDACTNGHTDVIRILLKNGANVTCVNYSNKTPLDCLIDFIKRSPNLSSYEKKDFQMLINQLRTEMKKKGYIEKKAVKRPFSSILSTESSQIDFDEHETSKSSKNFSPPHKSSCNRLNSVSNLRKNIEVNDFVDPVIQENFKPVDHRIESLIDENNIVDDDWLDDDLGLQNKPNKKTVFDAYECGLNKEKNSVQKLPKTKNLVNAEFKEIKENKKTNYFEEDSNSYNDSEFIESSLKSPLVDLIIESSSSSDSNNFENLIKSHENSIKNNTRKRKKQTKINKYFDIQNQDDSPVIIECSKANRIDEKNDVNMENQVKNKFKNSDQNVNKFVGSNKLKVRVHIDEMILLIPIPNDNTTIEWLKKETIDRYYKFKKIKPIIVLKTMDGAFLSSDDLIIDVLTNMEVNVEIESFDIKPINIVYNELCVINNLKPITDLDYELRISMASGFLNLKNCFLDKKHFDIFVSSLKMQLKIKVIDMSYSNLIKLDENFNLIKTIFSLTNLEVLNLECTGLNRLHISEIAKQETKSLINLNLNYNFLVNSLDLINDFLEKNKKLLKLSLQYTDITDELVLNLRLNQIIEKNSNLQIFIDTLSSSNFVNSKFIQSSLNVMETKNNLYLEFKKKLFIGT